MNVNGEYRLSAPRERIWEALRDPGTLRACIPGCESLIKVAEREFDLSMTAQVGAVATTWAGKASLAEEDFPRRWTLAARMQSVAAGFAEGEATITLTAEGGGTVLGYRARLEPGGRLASVGPRLLNGVAIRMANEFFSRLIERLAPPRPGAEPQDLAEPVPVARTTRILNTIAPATAATTGPRTPGAPANPPPESNVTANLSYSTEVDPRTQKIAIACGLIVYLMIVLLILWPR